MGNRAFLVVATLLGLQGCGPSHRMVHESTVYFERCYAAELDDRVPMDMRSQCWERWLRWYSPSQTQIRVLYARERLVYLAQGEIADPLPSPESSGDETAAPAPTGSTTETGLTLDSSVTSGSASAAAPGTPPAAPAARPAMRQRRNPRRAGSEICEPVCRPGWDACVDRCPGAELTCIAACQSEYASCMSGCI